MWQWLQRRRQEEARARAAEHQAYLDALKAVVEVVQAQSRASEAMAETIRTWFEMFKVEGAPVRWANDDLSESLQAAERLRNLQEQGFPAHFSVEDQAAWVAAFADRTF